MIREILSPGVRAAVLAAALMLGGLAAQAQTVEGAKPADPQPSEDQLKPGLAVSYVEEYFNDLSEMMGGEGTPGEPIANLDATPGRNEPVLTSGKAMGVGAYIRGYIKLDEPGTWTFRVNSNDGIQVTIGGQVVHVDPYKHSDTMSPPILFAVAEPGWYPIEVDYFQRKGTATLQLLWTRPSGGAEEIVPPEAFTHGAD
jgi:hypothetical protein